MKRTITGRPAGRTMTLGELRQFVGSLDALPDEAQVKAKVTRGKLLRSVTVEEEDASFREYIQAVSPEERDEEVASSGAKGNG